MRKTAFLKRRGGGPRWKTENEAANERGRSGSANGKMTETRRQRVKCAQNKTRLERERRNGAENGEQNAHRENDGAGKKNQGPRRWQVEVKLRSGIRRKAKWRGDAVKTKRGERPAKTVRVWTRQGESATTNPTLDRSNRLTSNIGESMRSDQWESDVGVTRTGQQDASGQHPESTNALFCCVKIRNVSKEKRLFVSYFFPFFLNWKKGKWFLETALLEHQKGAKELKFLIY